LRAHILLLLDDQVAWSVIAAGTLHQRSDD